MANRLKQDTVQLIQRENANVLYWDASETKLFSTLGLRGLMVQIPVSNWNAADLLFFVDDGPNSGFLRDDAGTLIRISGVTAGSWHTAPATIWHLGAMEKATIVSVGAGTEVRVSQTSPIKVARSY